MTRGPRDAAQQRCTRRTVGFLLAAALAGTACSWVSLNGEGERVKLLEPNQLTGSCQKIGSASARTLSRIVFVARSEQKISDELAILARNEAGRLGGDTVVVVPSSLSVEGEQSFDVYRCSID
jgi:hypothetical protein